MNVVHQFEKINTWKNLVSIHPWNIDFLLSKNHMLLLLTTENCESCEDAETVFVSLLSLYESQTNLAKRGVRGVIVGHLNCKRYPDFCVGVWDRIEGSIGSTWRIIRSCSSILRDKTKTNRFMLRKNYRCSLCEIMWRTR